jgi:hypothetical protein
MSVSIKAALECAKSVMWLGPNQMPIFVMHGPNGSCLISYDELQELRKIANTEPEFIVVPGEFEGECVVL